MSMLAPVKWPPTLQLLHRGPKWGYTRIKLPDTIGTVSRDMICTGQTMLSEQTEVGVAIQGTKICSHPKLCNCNEIHTWVSARGGIQSEAIKLLDPAKGHNRTNIWSHWSCQKALALLFALLISCPRPEIGLVFSVVEKSCTARAEYELCAHHPSI